MICKNCEIEFEGKYSKWCSGDFCSKKCACSFSTKEKRQEINEKVSCKFLKREKKYCCKCNKKMSSNSTTEGRSD